MTKAKYQALWRERKRNGLIYEVYCPICGKTSRANSNKSPYHYKCWLKTDDGKKYLREKQKQSRDNRKKYFDKTKE